MPTLPGEADEGNQLKSVPRGTSERSRAPLHEQPRSGNCWYLCEADSPPPHVKGGMSFSGFVSSE